MEGITGFIGSHYGWFLTISILLLFALIGYIVDDKREKAGLKKKDNDIDDEYIKHLTVSNDVKLDEQLQQNPNFGTINSAPSMPEVAPQDTSMTPPPELSNESISIDTQNTNAIEADNVTNMSTLE